MSETNTTVARSKGMSTLIRARFGPGMLLQHEDLEQLNAYTRDLSRLMFRSFFGWGVVCGLEVTPPDPKCVKFTVKAGLALDACGDPIYLPNDHTFVLKEKCDQDVPEKLYVVLCRDTPKGCAPRTSVCASEEDEAPVVCTREREVFEIRVVSGTQGICGCPEEQALDDEDACRCIVNPEEKPCYKNHYKGTCDVGHSSGCSCECVVLAKLTTSDKGQSWAVDHRVRRFIRPVLMRDPLTIKPHAT